MKSSGRSYTADEIKEMNYNLDLCGFPKEEEEILPPKELIEKYQSQREAHERIMDSALNTILQKIGGAQ